MKNLLITAVVAGLMLGGCLQEDKQENTQTKQQEKPALPIKVYEVKDQKTMISKTYPATIEPSQEVEVAARVSGRLVKMHFKEGQTVQKGDLLYTIEQQEYYAALQKAQADVEKAQARYEKAQKDYDRAKSLIQTNSISSQQYDQDIFEYADAKAAVKAARAQLQSAQINYDYTQVTAPISGVVGKKNFDIGDFVGTAQNSSLITITATDPVYAEFSIPKEDVQSYLSQIQDGSIKIYVHTAAQQKKGTIDYIAPKIDPQTDTLLLRAVFQNSNNALIPGEFTTVSMENIFLKDVAIIPEQALLKTARGNFVNTIKEGVSKMTPVEVGMLSKEGVVIKSGLAKGDVVAISNIAKLRPDTKVQIMEKE